MLLARIVVFLPGVDNPVTLDINDFLPKEWVMTDPRTLSFWDDSFEELKEQTGETIVWEGQAL